MDYRRYSIRYPSLVCEGCVLELMQVGGQIAVNTVLYVIKEHEREAHDA